MLHPSGPYRVTGPPRRLPPCPDAPDQMIRQGATLSSGRAALSSFSSQRCNSQVDQVAAIRTTQLGQNMKRASWLRRHGTVLDRPSTDPLRRSASFPVEGEREWRSPSEHHPSSLPAFFSPGEEHVSRTDVCVCPPERHERYVCVCVCVWTCIENNVCLLFTVP